MEKVINETTLKELGNQFGKAIANGNIKATKIAINEIMELPNISLIHLHLISSVVAGIVCGELKVYGVAIKT
jgi:hypothetical protein